MLKQMRDGAKSTLIKFVLFGLLLLAMIGLALIGGQGVFDSISGNDVVAKVGGSAIHSADFERMVRDELNRKNVRVADAVRAGVPRKILNQEIDRRIFALAAADADILPGDVLAARQIKNIIAPLVKKGMTEKEALDRLEQAYNMSEPQLVASVKSDIATQLLFNVITAGTAAPAQLVGDALKFRNEYRSGLYFILTPQDVPPVKPPSEAALKAYYDSVQSDYTLPEYRTLTVMTLSRKDVGAAIKIPEAQLKEHYKNNIDEYKTPETRVIAQAVAPDEATAQRVYAAAEKGHDLRAAAKSAGVKVSYILPEPFTRQQIAPALNVAAFAGKTGTITAPIKTQLGWHVLYIKKITPGVIKPFSAVKKEIESTLAQDKIDDSLFRESNTIEDGLGAGSTLTEIAKQYKLPVTVLQKVDAHGIGADGKKQGGTLPNLAKLLATGFSLGKGEASQMIETPDGSYQAVGVSDIYPSRQPSFEAVRTAVLARWMKEQTLDALNAKAEKIRAALKHGTSFDKLAAEEHQPIRKTGLIRRGESSNEAKLSDNMLDALFAMNTVGEATTVSDGNMLAILRLAGREIRMPSGSALQADRQNLAGVMQRLLSNDLVEQYRQSLWEKYNVTVNDKLLNSLYSTKDDDSD